jgi:hypothetical protein
MVSPCHTMLHGDTKTSSLASGCIWVEVDARPHGWIFFFPSTASYVAWSRHSRGVLCKLHTSSNTLVPSRSHLHSPADRGPTNRRRTIGKPRHKWLPPVRSCLLADGVSSTSLQHPMESDCWELWPADISSHLLSFPSASSLLPPKVELAPRDRVTSSIRDPHLKIHLSLEDSEIQLFLAALNTDRLSVFDWRG